MFRQNIPTRFIVSQLTDRQRAIFGLVKVNPSITAGEMSRTLHVSERTIRRDISGMPFLKHEGARNAGRWVVFWDYGGAVHWWNYVFFTQERPGIL